VADIQCVQHWQVACKKHVWVYKYS
jgi:hypothetical protein